MDIYASLAIFPNQCLICLTKVQLLPPPLLLLARVHNIIEELLYYELLLLGINTKNTWQHILRAWKKQLLYSYVVYMDRLEITP